MKNKLKIKFIEKTEEKIIKKTIPTNEFKICGIATVKNYYDKIGKIEMEEISFICNNLSKFDKYVKESINDNGYGSKEIIKAYIYIYQDIIIIEENIENKLSNSYHKNVLIFEGTIKL